MQVAFGLDHPDYGFLHASAFSYEETPLHLNQFIKPCVELEPAFVLHSSLKGPNVTVADVINAVDYVLPAIEIIDSRVKNWAIDLPDTLADNGSNGGVILGGTPKKGLRVLKERSRITAWPHQSFPEFWGYDGPKAGRCHGRPFPCYLIPF